MLTAIFLFVNSCCCHKSVVKAENNPSGQTRLQAFENEGFFKASVYAFPVDGCTFMIHLQSGEKLEPINLKQEFAKDSLPVWIKYHPNIGGMSICMAGRQVVVDEMHLRE